MIFQNLFSFIILDQILPKLVDVFVLLTAELKHQVLKRDGK